MNAIRSLLFVPGSRSDRFDKALAAGADLICIDLEDAVLPDHKDSARAAVLDYIAKGNNKVCVRINPVNTDVGQQDLAAFSQSDVAYVMLAKCSSAADVKAAETAFANNNIQLIALIESLDGLTNAVEIAKSSTRLSALMFGGADMSAELRCEFSYEPLLFARSQLVFAAAQANLQLIDVPYIDIKDEAGLVDETKRIKALGYSAKAAIHPVQIATIHQVLTPTAEQVSYAEKVIAASEAAGGGVLVVDGRMIDRPIVLASQRILQVAALAH